MDAILNWFDQIPHKGKISLFVGMLLGASAHKGYEWYKSRNSNPYYHNYKQDVIIRALGKSGQKSSLRVAPSNLDEANCLGTTGKYARWRMISHGNNIYQLQNMFRLQRGHLNSFIRILNGTSIDVKGRANAISTKFCLHFVKREGDKIIVMFESRQHPNKYLACNSMGELFVCNGCEPTEQCSFEISPLPIQSRL